MSEAFSKNKVHPALSLKNSIDFQDVDSFRTPSEIAAAQELRAKFEARLMKKEIVPLTLREARDTIEMVFSRPTKVATLVRESE